jgi:peptidoglycan L-alanyl-D-glutamate endopeptidase CwlK
MALGTASRTKLATCHLDLRRLVEDVVAQVDAGALATAGVTDLTVLCGYRGQKEQDQAFKEGNSKLRFPNSRHNSVPSMAVDLAPFPLDWKNRDAFLVLRGFVLARAAALGIKLRTISWDLPHFELPR